MSLPVPEPDASTRLLVPRPGREVTALLTEALVRAGAFEATLRWVRLVQDVSSGDPANGVVVVDARTDPAAEAVPVPALTRLLSALTGGFVVSFPLRPADTGCRAAYAGHLMPTGLPAGTSPEPALEASQLLERIAGSSLGVLNLRRVAEQGEVTARAHGASPGRSAVGPHEPDRLRIAIVAADIDEVRRAVHRRRAELSGEWRLLSGLTPEAAIPFTMLRSRGGEDTLPDSVLRGLAGDVGMYAVSLDLPATQGLARWVWAGPGQECTTGSAHSLAAVGEVLSRVAAVLGTYPATLAWPAAEAGELLDAR